MLDLMARLSHDHPDIVPDLMSHSVEAAEAHGMPLRKWSWLDVGARAVDLYSSLLTTVHSKVCVYYRVYYRVCYRVCYRVMCTILCTTVCIIVCVIVSCTIVCIIVCIIV